MPHEREGGFDQRNITGSWWRFPPQGGLVEPALGLLHKLAKREMSSEPLHHLGLPLNEESREKLSSRLRTNELWELASHLVDLIADPVSGLLEGLVGPVPVSIRWHQDPSRSPRSKRYTFSRSVGAGTLGGAIRGPGGGAQHHRESRLFFGAGQAAQCAKGHRGSVIPKEGDHNGGAYPQLDHATNRLGAESPEDPAWVTFECTVNGPKAMAWLDENRPEAAAAIRSRQGNAGY